MLALLGLGAIRSSEMLDRALAQVEALGGAIIMPRTDIGAVGHFALIRDTEGNRVGLHIPTGAQTELV